MAQDAFRPLADYLVWSAKETALKILREGLRRDTRSVQIHVDPWERDDTWNSWNGCCRESSRVFHGWWRARDGFVYTMASSQRSLIPEELLIPR
jgi:4'-phosphopantetheinyl transferase